jgi:hypothetical protein
MRNEFDEPEAQHDREQQRQQIDWRVEQSLRQDEIMEAILQFAAVIEPDGQYDPEDDPRIESAHAQLAHVLEEPIVAGGIERAVRELWRRWVQERATD